MADQQSQLAFRPAVGSLTHPRMIISRAEVERECDRIDAAYDADPTWVERRSRCHDEVLAAVEAIDSADPDEVVRAHLTRALVELDGDAA